jgi:hypothetical protein
MEGQVIPIKNKMSAARTPLKVVLLYWWLHFLLYLLRFWYVIYIVFYFFYFQSQKGHEAQKTTNHTTQLITNSKNSSIWQKSVLNFIFFINMDVRVSLCVSRLISWAMKLTTMKVSSDLKRTQTYNHWKTNSRSDQLS